MLNETVTVIEGERMVTDDLPADVAHMQVDIGALVSTVVPGGKHTSILLSSALPDCVRECHAIMGINSMHCLDLHQQAPGRIEHTQGTKDKETWAHQWAIVLRDGDEKACDLNKNQKACLGLFQALCNHWGG